MPPGPLPSPPTTLNPEPRDPEESIDPETGQPVGGWNKARSIAGPVAGLLGLLALKGKKYGTASGLLGFGKAAEGGWQQDRMKYEKQKEREDLEAQDWARKKRDELDQLDLNDPKYAQLKTLRADLTKTLAERKLRPSSLKKYQAALGQHTELMQEAREVTDLSRQERAFLRKWELELKAQDDKQLRDFMKANPGMPPHIAKSMLADDMKLELEANRKKLQDIMSSPTRREQFEQDAKQFGMSTALQYDRMRQDESQFGRAQGAIESRFQRSLDARAAPTTDIFGAGAAARPRETPLGTPGQQDVTLTPDGKAWRWQQNPAGAWGLVPAR